MDIDKHGDEITMEIIVEIAESVDDIVKFTADMPSKHKSNKIAILDVEVNINKKEQNRIDYEFYEKPSKNKRVILEDAALPAPQKRTILTQECLRRLRNTKIELGKETQVKHLNNFMLTMKNSGYPVKYRTEILNSSLKAFDDIIEADRAGIKPLFRDRDWNREVRDKLKQDKKQNWYKNPKSKIKYKSVINVPVTKGSKLLKDLTKREEETNKFSDERIKFVEGGGIKMKDILVKKNPFPIEKCESKKCLICESIGTGGVQIACTTSNVGYQLICDTCRERGKNKVYEGETSRSAKMRGYEHRRGYNGEKMDNVLYKHKQLDHENEDMKFSMKITQKFRDPLTRQANEAVRMNSRPKNEVLNSKNEFNHPPIPRIVVEKRKGGFQPKYPPPQESA